VNEKAFSQALRRGLGGAIIELKNAEDKVAYREMLLRCCLRDITFDWQVEGSKGEYLYDAILASDEPEYFERCIIERFLSRCPDGLFRQWAEILYLRARDGSELSHNTLHAKYEYFASKKGRLAKTKTVDEGYQWDEVTFYLLYLDGFTAFKRYAEDVGQILIRKPEYQKSYDDWYRRRAEARFGKKRIESYFNTMYDTSDAIRALVDMITAAELAYGRILENREKEPLQVCDVIRAAKEAATDKHPRRRILRLQNGSLFAYRATDEQLEELAQVALLEENETVKALLLFQFRQRPFPLGITPLLDYTQSDNELLVEASLCCLEEYKDKRLHDLAIQLLKTKGLGSKALGLLIKNYQKTDDHSIAELIRKASRIPHHVQMDIRDIYQNHRSTSVFPLLFHVYQKGDCSFCRLGIVEAMHHCSVLPDDLLSECLYDSYDDTRRLARRLIAKRQKKVEQTR